ncbi:MAG: hypothetical protein HY299_00780 [Verrucomicrobia bacterium]|nr:hypothetical protein [Verrucomicrobiota bacterium]
MKTNKFCSAWSALPFGVLLGFFINSVESLALDATPTSTVRVIHSFLPPAPGEDARIPYAPLLFVPADNLLYGVGSAGPAGSFKGALFRISPSGDFYDLIYAFSGTEVRSPGVGLLLASDGALYGTAASGGAARGAFGGVYRLNRDTSGFEQLHVFSSSPDGAGPSGALVEGPGGFLYGVTDKGGSSGGAGTVFKLSKSGTDYETIRSFSAAGGGPARPAESLTVGGDGMLYGVSAEGGVNQAGTVYRMTADGSAPQVLRSFSTAAPDADGQTPSGALVQVGDWILGVASRGGSRNGGIVYRLQLSGDNYQVLHRFAGAPAEGSTPYGQLTLGLDGKLYGTTLNGGSGGVGTIYRIGAAGEGFETVWHFQRGDKGPQLPQSGLALGSEGEFYGTSTGGGDTGFGTVFRFHPPIRCAAAQTQTDWVFEWTANGLTYHLQQTDRIDPPISWDNIDAEIEKDGTVRRLRTTIPTSTRFFRLFADE